MSLDANLRKSDWFESQSIAFKLKLIVGSMMAFITLICVLCLGGLLIAKHVNANYFALSNDVVLAAEVDSLIAKAQVETEHYMSTADRSRLTETRGFLASTRSKLAQLNLDPADARVTGDVAKLKAAIDHFESEQLGKLETRLGDSRRGMGQDALTARNEVSDAGHNLGTVAGVLHDSLLASRDVAHSTSATVGNIFMVLVPLFLIAVIVQGLIALRKVGPPISGAIRHLTEATQQLVDGDTTIAVPETGRPDEIGDLARSLEVFRDKSIEMERMRQEREGVSNQHAEMLRRLADQFERTVGDVVGGVAAASSQLQTTASSMAAAAEQSAVQTNDVSTALGEASSGVTAAAAASDEFAMSIGEISRQASNSAELARVAAEEATKTDATISALADSAQQVGQIVELISSIAQRTNLLALNASIEAARGGEAGRGFAVVASEVKDLAAQTSKATDEIAQQIRAIQETTHASVTALRSIGKQVGKLETTSISIAAAVDQQSVAGQDLARSIDLAARSTDEVSSNIAHVRETSLATGAAASQVLNSSTELEQQAAVLTSQVRDFLNHVRAA